LSRGSSHVWVLGFSTGITFLQPYPCFVCQSLSFFDWLVSDLSFFFFFWIFSLLNGSITRCVVTSSRRFFLVPYAFPTSSRGEGFGFQCRYIVFFFLVPGGHFPPFSRFDPDRSRFFFPSVFSEVTPFSLFTPKCGSFFDRPPEVFPFALRNALFLEF